MPQPIDPNTEFMRIHAVQRVQEAQDRAAMMAQARQVTQQTEEQIRRETTVNRPEQQEPAVDRETRRRAPFRNETEQRERKKGQQQSEHEQEPDVTRPSSGAEDEPHHFDVSI
ncbi:MAG TPA: hypothetical protein PK379_08670 [Candidatus Hydrogenedentes bacterium]|nr:hypothetical protein [Candidatus Hydrogenedentota bacterium]HOJ68936.1 hypothetical protein [Candidatus Hydrogenedentota bacterium]HOK90087.1 hypothetical protein [Candidatus Hydrogenedentota bacterium]